MIRPCLLAVAVSLCFNAIAEEAATVVVTGARFDAEPSLAPIGSISQNISP